MHLRHGLPLTGAIAIAGLALAVQAFAVGLPVQPGTATAEKFPASSSCGCHSTRMTEWTQSMHAKAIVDPVFRYKVGLVEDEAGPAVAAFCRRCHSPIGNMTGDPAGTKPPAAEGVACMYCHQVVGSAGEPGNTSHLVEANLTRRAQIKDPSAPHPAVYSELHVGSEICGGCHNVNHPANGTHLEATYAEWSAGPYAKEGVVCQDCHMSAKAGLVGPTSGTACAGGRQRDTIFAMSFVGANVGQGPAESSRALLQRAAQVDVRAPAILADGNVATVTVTVTNVGAGHFLPTGLTEERQMWLSVYAESPDGKRVLLGEKRYGTTLKDAGGGHPSEMWNAAAVFADERIPPRGSSSVEYAFDMPMRTGQTRLVAVLSYKSLPDELAAKAGVNNPVTEMATDSRNVFASQAEKDLAEKAARSAQGGWANASTWLPVAIVATLLTVLGVAATVLLRSRRN